MSRHITTWVMSLALLCVLGLSQAQAFTHPCIPNTLEELDTIKANLDKEPWKSGYAVLAADGRSQLGYALAYGGGASILRGTWPGRTQQDTHIVKDCVEIESTKPIRSHEAYRPFSMHA